MPSHDVLTIILSIGIPMCAGFGWIIAKLFSVQKDLNQTKLDIQTVKSEIQADIRGLDVRMAHMEGYITGCKERTGT